MYGWGDKKEVVPERWKGSTWDGINSGNGWDKTTDQNDDSRWGKSFTSWDNEPVSEKKLAGGCGESTKKGGTNPEHHGMYKENMGWEGRLDEEHGDGWGKQKDPIYSGWGQTEVLSAIGGCKGVVQGESHEKLWTERMHGKDDDGWGDMPREMEKPTQEQNLQNSWGESMHQEKSDGWAEDKVSNEWGNNSGASTSDKRWRGSGNVVINDGWGCNIHKGNEWLDKSAKPDDGSGEKKFVSGGTWGKNVQEKGTGDRWRHSKNASPGGYDLLNKRSKTQRNNTFRKDDNHDGWTGSKKHSGSQWNIRKIGPISGCKDDTEHKIGDGWDRPIAKITTGWEESKHKDDREHNVGDGWNRPISESTTSWQDSKQNDFDDGWGISTQGQQKGRPYTACGHDAENNFNDDWDGTAVDIATGWKESTHKDIDDGWGSIPQNSVQLKTTGVDSGPSDSRKKSGIFNSWEKSSAGRMGKDDRSDPETWRNNPPRGRADGAWNDGIQDVDDDGWCCNTQNNIDSGWGETDAALREGDGYAATGREQSGNQDIDDGPGGNIQKKVAVTGWEQLERQDTDDGWGGSIGKGADLVWKNHVDTRANPNNPVVVDDTDGWNAIKNPEAVTGWQISEEQSPRNRHSGHKNRYGPEWAKNTGADKRRPGTFGPSGANTLPLGKRRGGIKCSNWGQRITGALEQQNEGDLQGGKPKLGRRFNNGRCTGVSSSQNYSTRPHLRTLISSGEYSELNELYKTTNKILHHSGYEPGDRLNADDAKFVLEQVLAHHPEKEVKLGCGAEYVMIDSHADHQVNCFWVVRKDSSKTDFSYWKCLERLFEMNYSNVMKKEDEAEKDGSISTHFDTEKPPGNDEVGDWKDSLALDVTVEAEAVVRQETDNGR
ncbi:hypothetical protein KP509_03G053200 [Ceratopteris richardii]|nr:hypothetical protein KP509_03G053200 [Ceratopteris richardii]